MQTIKRLPKSVHSSLRSSVVLSDLPRVVEELIYNSIDANASKIDIAINIRACYVKVEDDGCAITRDELVLLGEKYTTSKFHNVMGDGELSPRSFGLNGEALASLSDISVVEIRTKARGRNQEDGFSASTSTEIQVVECDASSLNQNIFGKFSRQGSCHHSGVWSAKDGCVYKAVICPFCSPENACATILGVQVLATDKPNQQLVEKVLLFSERLDVKPEPSKRQASRTQRDGRNSISSPPVIDLESFAYKPLKKDPVPLNSRRSKLRLPTTNKSTTGT